MSGATVPVRVCFAFTPWKRRILRDYFAGEPGELVFLGNPRDAVARSRSAGASLYCWGAAARARLAPFLGPDDALTIVEDGFIRSSGLGVHNYFPASLCFDDVGIYYDPSRPSRLERILATEEPDEGALARARALTEALVASRVTKYNLSGGGRVGRPAPGRKAILVPGQVEDDQSVLLGGCGTTRNIDLLRTVREREPDAWIVYKPHPDVLQGYRKGHVSERQARRWCDAVVRDQPISDLYDVVDEVHTLTSQAGFEALLRGKAVATYGGPFYAGWGLTTDLIAFPRRRPISLEALVWGALLRYPRYLHPVTRQAADALGLVRAFAGGLRSPRVPAPLEARLYHLFVPPARRLLRDLFLGR